MRECLISVVKWMYTHMTSIKMKGEWKQYSQFLGVWKLWHQHSMYWSWYLTKKRGIICPSLLTGTICSLMHIDVRIKANHAARQASPLPSPLLPFPPCSHLFVPVLKHEHQTCPADSPSNAPQRFEGHMWSLALSPHHSPLFYPAYIHRRLQLQWCVPVSKSMHGPAGARLSRLQIDKFLPWTLTQIALGRGLCVAIPYVPLEYAVTYLPDFSSASWQAPPVLFLSLLLVQELCHCVSRRDAKPVGSHLKVTLTSLPLLWLPWLVPRLFRQVEE